MIRNFLLSKGRHFHTDVLVKSDFKPLEAMPGPRGFLGLGNIFDYIKPFGRYSWDELHISGMDKYKRYGPIVCERMVPGVSVVWLYDPNDFAKVFNDSASNLPCRRSHLALEKFRRDRPDIYRTGGLLPTNGYEWWKIRSEFQKSLSSPKNVRNLLPCTDQITREFIAMLPSQLDSEGTIRDMLVELERLSLEQTCLITFDERLYSFSESERREDSKSSLLIKTADDTNNCILPTDQGLQLWRLFETASYKQLRESQEYMQQVAIELVQRRASQQEKDGNSLLDQYLKNPNLNIKDLIGMSCDLLLGGVHTTSFSNAFALYHIARDTRVQELMSEEARRVLPTDDSEVTTNIMNSEIPYTRAVLKEVFRLHPISVGVGRILSQDTVLSGYLVPKNTTIVTQNYVACRLAENFSQPLEFVPERWIKVNGEKSNINPYLVIPFGHGMRSCIARRFAEQAILVFLLRLIRDYRIEWRGGAELDTETKLINRPKGDVTIYFERR